MKAIIKDIFARQILDSRGNPTIEVDVTLENGSFGRASVPSGASTGFYEAVELRDGDKSNYNGKSVNKAVTNVNTTIKNALIGFDGTKQNELDALLIKLDGTKNKSILGANAILGVSLAVARAVANFKNIELYEYLAMLYGEKASILPTPMLNILNGGKHADNNVNIQEFMIVPLEKQPFSEALRKSVDVYVALKAILKSNHYNTTVGDEGGFAPNLKQDEDALKFIVESIIKAGYQPNKDFGIALDIASSEMKGEAEKIGKNDCYYFWKTDKLMTASEFIEYQQYLIENYPIVSIEDGLDEDDFENWKIMNEKLGGKIQLVGDDLFVTNTERLRQGIEEKLANAILIKPNQIGTLTETLNAIKLAQEKKFGTIISHRSGETDDSFIADLAVATNAGQIKTGAPARIDRVAKYNRLIRIEQHNPSLIFLGKIKQ